MSSLPNPNSIRLTYDGVKGIIEETASPVASSEVRRIIQSALDIGVPVYVTDDKGNIIYQAVIDDEELEFRPVSNI